jgi:hypothetical protein
MVFTNREDCYIPQTLNFVSISSGFTYQGQLKQNGAPADNICDMAFRLYDASSNGGQIGIARTVTQTMMNRLLTVTFKKSRKWRRRCAA